MGQDGYAEHMRPSKYPNTEHIPKTLTTIPNIEAMYTPYLGTLDPLKYQGLLDQDLSVSTGSF